MEFLGYGAAIFIGLVLGLVGAGGSILTVPVMVYLMDIDPVLATSYSLVVVGTTALAGSTAYMKKEQVNYKTAVIFAIPAFTAVFITRMFILPAIPETIGAVAGIEVTKDLAVMLLFAVLMILSAYAMIRGRKDADATEEHTYNYPLIAVEAFGVGMLTGLVGAGGGFLIIPALVALMHLPMKTAVGTSLLIIAVNSLIGVLGDVGHVQMNWLFLGGFTALTVTGIFFGSWLSRFISGARLKPAFGWFILAMGVYIIGSEVFIKQL